MKGYNQYTNGKHLSHLFQEPAHAVCAILWHIPAQDSVLRQGASWLLLKSCITFRQWLTTNSDRNKINAVVNLTGSSAASHCCTEAANTRDQAAPAVDCASQTQLPISSVDSVSGESSAGLDTICDIAERLSADMHSHFASV